MNERRVRSWLVTIAAIGAAGLMLSLQLLVPPVVGLANEGDLERVMGYVGFFYLTDNWNDKYYGHIVTTFKIVPPGWYVSGYLTSETLLAFAARYASLGLFPGRHFDLRILGAIHMLLLLAAIGLLLRACRDSPVLTQIVAAALLVLVFTDVGYAAALNSFYPQTASLLFLLITLGCAAIGARDGRFRVPILALFFLSAALFVCSKPQEVIHVPVLAGLGILLAAGTGEPRPRGLIAASGVLAAALGVLAIWYYREIPRGGIRNVGLFHTYFHDLLQHSPTPDADMKELGIDADLRRYVGMHAYMKEAPMEDSDFQARFFDRFGYAKLASFYVRHPDRFVDRLCRAAPGAFRLRPKYLGNFEKSTGVPPRTKATRFALWSDFRARLEKHAAAVLLIVFGSNLLAAALAYRRSSPRGRLALAILVACLLIAVLEFGVCAFADALDDLGRHLFVFHALVDLVLVADIAWLTSSSPGGSSDGSWRFRARRASGRTPS